MENALSDLEPRASSGRHDFEASVHEFVLGILRSVDAELRYQPSGVVYETIRERVRGRLPGVHVDDAELRAAAARISKGRPV